MLFKLKGMVILEIRGNKTDGSEKKTYEILTDIQEGKLELKATK